MPGKKKHANTSLILPIENHRGSETEKKERTDNKDSFVNRMMKIFGKDKEEKKRRPVHCCPYAHRDRFLHFTKLKKAWKESKTKRKEKRYLHHMLLPRSTATLPNARAWDVAKPSFNPTPKNTNSFGNLFYISENNCQCFFFSCTV